MFDRSILKFKIGDQNRVACLVLLLVFASVLVIKFDYILHGTYFGEDLSYFYKSKFETGMNYHNVPILALLYHITANISPTISYQMLIYLLMLSMTSVVMWLLLSKFFMYPFVLICGILFAFTSHAIIGMIQYVAASHALVGLMFAFLGILFSYWGMIVDKSLMERVLLAVSGGAFIVFSSLSSPMFVLFTLIIPLHAYLVRKFFPALSGSMWVPMVFTFIPGLCSVLYNLIYNLYNYDKLLGWMDYTIGHASDRAISYVDYMLTPYMEIAPNFLILCYGSVIAASFLWISSKVVPAKNSPPSRLRGYYVAISVLSWGFVLTLIPVLSLTSNPGPRYVYPAMILAILAIFSAIDFLLSLWLRHFPQGKSKSRVKWILIASISVLLGWNFTITYEYQEKNYGSMIRFQPKFESFIRENEKLWPKSAQIVIASDDMPATFAKGYHDWSTRYLRLITRREDVIALFGQEKDMIAVEEPFVEFYDHGLDHGNFRGIVRYDGRPTYHHYGMVGLVKSRPTYAYRFDVLDGTVYRVQWLLVNASHSCWSLYRMNASDSCWSLYRMTGEGIVLHESGADTPADLDRLGIDRQDVFIYGKTN